MQDCHRVAFVSYICDSNSTEELFAAILINDVRCRIQLLSGRIENKSLLLLQSPSPD